MQTMLSAVNSLLTAIGDSPQNTLDVLNPDIAIAQSTIESASVDIQSEGWWFNKERWDMSLDTEGRQPVPVNALYVNTYNTSWVKRGVYLYDLAKHTYDLSETDVDSLSMIVTTELPLEELPGLVYNCIINIAKVQFLTELEGEYDKAKFAQSMANTQYTQMKKLNLKFSEPSALSSPTARKLLQNIQSYNTRG